MAESLENDNFETDQEQKKDYAQVRAMPATSGASLIVTQNRPGTTPVSEPKPERTYKRAPAPK